MTDFNNCILNNISRNMGNEVFNYLIKARNKDPMDAIKIISENIRSVIRCSKLMYLTYEDKGELDILNDVVYDSLIYQEFLTKLYKKLDKL